MKRLSLAITLAVVTAGCSGTPTPTAPDPGDSATILNVLDGDSLLVAIEGADVEVRLLGINTPERGECFYAESKARTTELAADRVGLVGEDTDRFGRVLRYAYAGDGTLLNQQLVAEGFALALTNDHPLLIEFKAAEAMAWERHFGRWQTDACGLPDDGFVSISSLQEDAPGNDSENPNGEFADIENDGDVDVDLTGWVLRDESSSHRFVFSDGFRLEPGNRVRVFSGCGDPSQSEQFFCDGSPVWSNGGDTAYLLDSSGNVADRFSF